MLARLRDSDESFDVRLEESFNPWEDDGMLTLSTRLDDNLYLYIQTPRGYLKSFADLAVKYTALMSIAILLVGAVIIYFVVGRITRPIQGIQRAADKISRLDFSERCEAKGHDEIAMLAGSVNQMSDDLQAAVSRWWRPMRCSRTTSCASSRPTACASSSWRTSRTISRRRSPS